MKREQINESHRNNNTGEEKNMNKITECVRKLCSTNYFVHILLVSVVMGVYLIAAVIMLFGKNILEFFGELAIDIRQEWERLSYGVIFTYSDWKKEYRSRKRQDTTQTSIKYIVYSVSKPPRINFNGLTYPTLLGRC